MRKNLIFIIAIVITLGLVGYAYYRHITSPAYSLKQIVKAYNEHDFTLFEKHVDIETIMDGVLDARFNEMDAQSTSLTAGERLGEQIGKGLINILRPQIAELWKKQTRALIETGRMGGETEKFSLEDQWGKSKNIHFQGAKEISREGKVANIGLIFMHPRFDTTLTLNVLMRDKGGYWQLFDVTDIANYGDKLDELEQKRIDGINEGIKLEIGKLLSLESIDVKARSSGCYLVSYRHDVLVKFRNVSGKPITKFGMMAYVKDSNGENIDRVVLGSDKIVQPNGLIKDESFTYATDDPKVYMAPFSIEVSYATIEFADGSVIKTVGMWEPVDEVDGDQQ